MRQLERLKRLADPFRPHLEPAFLIIGAQKAGTSALFKLLAAHQQVLAPVVKEHHHFDRDLEYEKGQAHYLRGFPLRPIRTGPKVTFEATPNYLFQPAVPARIHARLPHIRLIAVLRDPVSRAHSAWNMYHQFADHPRYAHLYDPRSFEQAVEDEMAGRTLLDPHRYLARGCYAPQLRRYFDLFGRDRMLLFRHDELDREPEAVMQRCTSFLGLEPYSGAKEHLSIRDNVRPYSQRMSPELRERLNAYFAPHMAELVALLGPEWDLRDVNKRATSNASPN